MFAACCVERAEDIDSQWDSRSPSGLLSQASGHRYTLSQSTHRLAVHYTRQYQSCVMPSGIPRLHSIHATSGAPLFLGEPTAERTAQQVGVRVGHRSSGGRILVQGPKFASRPGRPELSATGSVTLQARRRSSLICLVDAGVLLTDRHRRQSCLCGTPMLASR